MGGKIRARMRRMSTVRVRCGKECGHHCRPRGVPTYREIAERDFPVEVRVDRLNKLLDRLIRDLGQRVGLHDRRAQREVGQLHGRRRRRGERQRGRLAAHGGIREDHACLQMRRACF